MPEKKKDKKSKSKKTTGQKQKQTQKQSVVVNVNTERKPRKRSNKKSQSKTAQPQGNNISINPVITFPSQEQMYRHVLTEVQNQPPPVLGNSNDINASIAGILNSIKQQNTPNKQEALASVIPKMEVLKEQATQSIKVENQFNKDIERIKKERTKTIEEDNTSLLGDDEGRSHNAANTIQGAVKGHLARNKSRARADEVVQQQLAPYNEAATTIQSVLRGHKGRKRHTKLVMDDFMNTDFAAALRNMAQTTEKNGGGNVVYQLPDEKTIKTLKKSKNPLLISTTPPPRKLQENVDTVSAKLVFGNDSNSPVPVAPAKRGRGRPAGSINKSKELKELEKNVRILAKSIVLKNGRLKPNQT